jgi:nitroreductase/NAD-dependent dihydropyrimidine dehydrogenase PreA subunit
MALLIIDESKCKSDGICVRDCPAAIIRLQEGSNFPEIVPGCEAMCLDCGHCVAVCPHGALSHRRISIESSPPIKEELRINEGQAVQFLRTRRSIRHFLDRPVEKEKIRRLIEAARYAPTGGNSQMVEWLVLSDRSRIKEIARLTIDWLRQMVKDPGVLAARPYLPRAVAAWDAGNDSVLRNAPVLVVAMAPREAMNGLVDLTLALSYLDLLASAMDLGTCWAGLLQGALVSLPSVKTALGIPESYPHHYPMMLGYPEFRYYRLPERKMPKIIFA